MKAICIEGKNTNPFQADILLSRPNNELVTDHECYLMRALVSSVPSSGLLLTERPHVHDCSNVFSGFVVVFLKCVCLVSLSHIAYRVSPWQVVYLLSKTPPNTTGS